MPTARISLIRYLEVAQLPVRVNKLSSCILSLLLNVYNHPHFWIVDDHPGILILP